MSKENMQDQYVDWLSLKYYDIKVKDYIDSKFDNSTDIKEVKVDIDHLRDDIEDVEDRVSQVVDDLRSTEHAIHDQLHSHEERLNRLTLPDLSEYALKEEIPSVEGLVSEQYVTEAIEEATKFSMDEDGNSVDVVTQVQKLTETVSKLTEHVVYGTW